MRDEKRLSLWKRRLLFRLGRWRADPTGPLRNCFMRMAYSDSTAPVIDGIRISDISADTLDEQKERFQAYIRDALLLIKTHDPVRYRRVVRHLRFIVNGPCASWARYEHELKACRIDFNWHPLEDDGTIHPWYVAAFAKTIVHEATHAYLMDRSISYTFENRVRVERACVDQQNVFLTKLPKEPYDYVAEFNDGMTDAEIKELFEGDVARAAEMRLRLKKQLAVLWSDIKKDMMEIWSDLWSKRRS
jgi:hypothetical protein